LSGRLPLNQASKKLAAFLKGVLTEYTKLIDDALEDASRLRLGKSAPNFNLYDMKNSQISLFKVSRDIFFGQKRENCGEN